MLTHRNLRFAQGLAALTLAFSSGCQAPPPAPPPPVCGDGRQILPPAGALLEPDNESALADDSASFVLRWEAEADECRDLLGATVFLKFLGGGEEPEALFDSPIQMDVEADGLDLDLVPHLPELNLQGGLWAWGVLADDGTETGALTATSESAEEFRTFLRDTQPRFVDAPTVQRRTCANEGRAADAVAFSFADDNGADTVAVTLFFSEEEDAVFEAPANTMLVEPEAFGPSGDDMFSFVRSGMGGGCPQFAHGAGFYGVELDDGANHPVRAMTELPLIDCNDNGTDDEEDIAGEGSLDCNGNEIPDECDITTGTSPDCNRTGVPDECELDRNDANRNGVPDECDGGGWGVDGVGHGGIGGGGEASADCNGNGVVDSVDVSSRTSNDCNANHTPDECDVAAGASSDCNRTGTPDECELTGNDDNGNGVPDECDPSSPDCNGNGIVDSSDVASGTSSDCNANNTPDECEHSVVLVDAGTLNQAIATGSGYSSGGVNDLRGTLCPDDVGLAVQWSLVSGQPGANVTIVNPNALSTPYRITFVTAVGVGDYVFRLSVLGTTISDTVTLRLTGGSPPLTVDAGTLGQAVVLSTQSCYRSSISAPSCTASVTLCTTANDNTLKGAVSPTLPSGAAVHWTVDAIKSTRPGAPQPEVSFSNSGALSTAYCVSPVDSGTTYEIRFRLTIQPLGALTVSDTVTLNLCRQPSVSVRALAVAEMTGQPCYRSSDKAPTCGGCGPRCERTSQIALDNDLTATIAPTDTPIASVKWEVASSVASPPGAQQPSFAFSPPSGDALTTAYRITRAALTGTVEYRITFRVTIQPLCGGPPIVRDAVLTLIAQAP